MTWLLVTFSCTCLPDTSHCFLMSLEEKNFVQLFLMASYWLLFPGLLFLPDDGMLSCLEQINFPLNTSKYNLVKLFWQLWNEQTFDSLMLVFYSKENVHRHTLRMLLHLHHKVLPSYMETLMKTLEPPKQVGFTFSVNFLIISAWVRVTWEPVWARLLRMKHHFSDVETSQKSTNLFVLVMILSIQNVLECPLKILERQGKFLCFCCIVKTGFQIKRWIWNFTNKMVGFSF